MLITKRSDYALRICRALKDGKTHNVREICEKEDVPKAFAYKIIREMELSGIVKSERGNKGGYFLDKSLDELTVYDIVSITEEDIAIVHCMKEECERNTNDVPCKMHGEMERIQGILEQEMKDKTIAEIIGQ
ncbi:MAG: Rrf2 family transcriptional regulator [Clostridia bacterium]|nr:Rrf2 family transcriptional regulator [Clostridia bacterium]